MENSPYGNPNIFPSSMDGEPSHYRPLPIFVHQRQYMNIEFNRNEDKMKQALSELRQRLEKIRQNGRTRLQGPRHQKLNTRGIPVRRVSPFF